ncbi:hypothetical protein AB0K71_05920 [Streptomyces syringium]|uniref:WDGH domain-containing protein n=1 Tax=Streptomyces syringium TaxID=76729 RepID=UPI003430FAC6
MTQLDPIAFSRPFVLQRDHDVSGVSGTGIVADGVEHPDGTVSIRWRGERPSTVFWDSIHDAMAVHGHGGATRIVWAGNVHRAEATLARVRAARSWVDVWSALGMHDGLTPEQAGQTARELREGGTIRHLADAEQRVRAATRRAEDSENARTACAAELAAAHQLGQEQAATIRRLLGEIRDALSTNPVPGAPDSVRTLADTAPTSPDTEPTDAVRAAPDTDDTALRDALGVLLSRAARGVLTPDEGPLLRQHAEHFIRDRDRLAAALSGRDEAAERVAGLQEEHDVHRKALADAIECGWHMSWEQLLERTVTDRAALIRQRDEAEAAVRTDPDPVRTAADLRGQYAAALDQCRVLVPEQQADAVLAVRDHQMEQLRQQLAAVEAERDAVYRERAHLIAHLAALHPSHIGHTDPNAPDWAVVIIETPSGQLSWHIAERDLDLVEHVMPTNRICRGWDGHTTDEKYERIRALTAAAGRSS